MVVMILIRLLLFLEMEGSVLVVQVACSLTIAMLASVPVLWLYCAVSIELDIVSLSAE